MKSISLKNFLFKPAHIAPLAIFRIVFGAILFFSIIRFLLNGWVSELYIEPQLYFPYYGFEWVKPFSAPFMYALFISLAISFLFQALGLFYKAASIYSFAVFTYIELIDKSNYLNHYYFVSIICLLLIFVPAHRYFSLDVWRKNVLKITHVPNYFIFIFQLQLAIVYFYAGLAKLNYDWMVNALPLKIWLPSKSNLPLFGTLLQKEWVAYLFSWSGAFYDLCIPFLLFYKRTRIWAYLLVIVFHLLTYALFQIGMFPFIMIGATLIFFSEEFHLNVISKANKLINYKHTSIELIGEKPRAEPILNIIRMNRNIAFFSFFIFLQITIPMRYLLYPNNLYWTEEGYRFSWRVMLMEKAGYAIFKVQDPKTNLKWEVKNYEFLTPNQEKMMSTQADMILQYAQFLEKHYQENGINNPVIKAEVYVTLNGRPSQLFIDSSLNLTGIKESFLPKKWILPLENS